MEFAINTTTKPKTAPTMPLEALRRVLHDLATYPLGLDAKTRLRAF